MVYPDARRGAIEVEAAFTDFAGDIDVKVLYADNAKEYKAACRELRWPFRGSTPGEKQTSGLAEGQVRLVKDGGRCALILGDCAYT